MTDRPYKSNLPSDAPSTEQEAKPLHASKLDHVPAISTLGLVAARMLQQQGFVALMVNQAGFIELVPPQELELDALDDQVALTRLIERGYSDEQLRSYLQQRDLRLGRR